MNSLVNWVSLTQEKYPTILTNLSFSWQYNRTNFVWAEDKLGPKSIYRKWIAKIKQSSILARPR